MTKLIIEVPSEKIQMVKDLLKAIGVKHSNLPKNRTKKEALTNVSVWTEKDVDAIGTVNKSMQSLSIKEW
ncbi:hypothetical protein M3O96_19105 [Aquiflexum sp. TKW24L]|uniref:hypothetical protein n=1 Tax=Aquiflexum sp. TKW24L TaxID=2942212 RepID=UPI0020BDA8B3|nr:hypothetical protein [Aquiflexum sp. TKW24L]MCL6261218.1 hypothetical protein [Aquiflexum sp. TKW24L]